MSPGNQGVFQLLEEVTFRRILAFFLQTNVKVILFPNQRKNWQRAVLSYVFTYERCQFWHDKRGDYAKMTNEETKVILTIQNQLWYNTAVRTCDAI